MCDLNAKLKTDGMSAFRLNILQGVGSSGLAFAVTIVTTPLMTRLFPTEAYGAYGLLNTSATIISAFGLLGLPIALAQIRKEAEQRYIFAVSIQIAVLLFCLLLIVVLLAFMLLPDGELAIPVWLLFLLPFMVFIHALQRISDSLATAEGHFPALARARVASAVSARGITLVGGWLFQAVAGTMALGDSFGKILHIAVTAHGGPFAIFWRNIDWRPLRWSSFSSVFSDYRDFALYSNLATILPLVMTLGVQAIIGKYFGLNETGQFVLAQSILTLPVTLLALASAPVIFHRFVTAADETPERLPRLTLLALLVFLLIGSFCMLPIALFGPELFAFFFGETWRPSGKLASILCYPQTLAFSLTILLSLFRITRDLRLWLILEVVGVVLVIGGFAVAARNLNFDAAIQYLVGLLIGYQILMLVGCLHVVRLHKCKGIGF